MEDVALSGFQCGFLDVLPAGSRAVCGAVGAVVVAEDVGSVVAHLDFRNGDIIDGGEEVPGVAVDTEVGVHGVGGHGIAGVVQHAWVGLVDEPVECAHLHGCAAADGELAVEVEVHVGFAVHTAVVGEREIAGELPIVDVVALDDGAKLIPVGVEFVVDDGEGGHHEGNLALVATIIKRISDDGRRSGGTRNDFLQVGTVSEIVVEVRVDAIAIIIIVGGLDVGGQLYIGQIGASLEGVKCKLFQLKRQHQRIDAAGGKGTLTDDLQ